MMAAMLVACSGSNAADRDPFTVLGPASDDSAPQRAAVAPLQGSPVLADPAFGYRWTLMAGWSPAPAREAIAGLAAFDGGAALAIRDDRTAQALLLVVTEPAGSATPPQGDPRHLAALEALVRKKANSQKLAVQSSGPTEVAGHPTFTLVGREGDRYSAHVHLSIFFAGRRRFELQCRRNASATDVCNVAFAELQPSR